MFQDAGFGLAAHDSGIAPDVYPPADQPERERILSALFASIKSQGVQGEYSGEFDFMQFLDHVQRARPVQGVVRTEPIAQPPMPTPVSRSETARDSGADRLRPWSGRDPVCAVQIPRSGGCRELNQFDP